MPVRFLVLTAFVLFAFDQPKLVKTKLTDKITASIPEGWQPMDNMDFTQRYPSVRAPLAAYTNAERNTDFSVNISASRWPDANAELAQQFYKASLMNMFDKVDMIKEGVREINGKKFIYFEFESRVNGNRAEEGNKETIIKYTYQQYLVGKDRTLVFTFNCPKRGREIWQGTAEAMMKSIKVK